MTKVMAGKERWLLTFQIVTYTSMGLVRVALLTWTHTERDKWSFFLAEDNSFIFPVLASPSEALRVGVAAKDKGGGGGIGPALFQAPCPPASQVVMEAVLFPSELIQPWAGLAVARLFVGAELRMDSHVGIPSWESCPKYPHLTHIHGLLAAWDPCPSAWMALCPAPRPFSVRLCCQIVIGSDGQLT